MAVNNDAKTAKYGDREDEMQVGRGSSGGGDDEEMQLLEDDLEAFEMEERSASRSGRETGDGGDDDDDDDDKESNRGRPGPSGKRRTGCMGFLYGPDPPRVLVLSPGFFPTLQGAPVRWLRRVLPRPWQRGLFLAALLAAWAVSLGVLLARSKGAVVDDEGRPIRHISCTDVLWRRNNECGLNGIDCRPFGNVTMPFRCPANCAGVRVLNPRHIGPLQVNYRPLVVGGGGGAAGELARYRGDSFMCGAAIHAGLVSDATGGCATAVLEGAYYRFPASSAHGIESIPFDSHFPLSFTLKPGPETCSAPDPRWVPLLPLSAVFSAALSMLTTSAPLLFFGAFAGLFAHVALAADPPDLSTLSSATLLPELLSLCAARLLPALACAAIVYAVAGRRALDNITPAAQADKTLLWVGGLWVGALSNQSLGWIPLSRLSAHDLAQQPGAKAALAGLVLVVLVAALLQMWHFRQEGRLPRMLAVYLGLLALIGCLAALPGLELRLHHYIIALLLLPGTGLQTRPSLLLQGLLLGLLINGAARWGFDSVIQTADGLRGDGAFGEMLPVLAGPPLTEAVQGVGRITFRFAALRPEQSSGLEGLSVLVNDVERYRGWFAEKPLEKHVVEWARRGGVVADEYFRFGFLGTGGGARDYTGAGTWFVNGSWSFAG